MQKRGHMTLDGCVSAPLDPGPPGSPKRRILLSGLALFPLSSRIANAAGNSLRIDTSQKYQTIEGFGTSLNTWHKDVAEAYQREDWAAFYWETLGASALRIELWGGVAPLPRERWQDMSWHDFSFDGPGLRAAITVGIAKRLNSVSRRHIRFIASTWTPPAWMKVNGTLGNGHPARKNFSLNFDDPVERGTWNAPHDGDVGQERYTYLGRNKLRPDRYLHFAKFLVEWSRYLESVGISLYALSPTNEPRFSHWFESCVYTPEEYAELLEVIAWMFANQRQPPIQIFGPEHMTWDLAGTQRYLVALARRQGAHSSLAALASHGYIDGYRADLRKESTSAFRNLAGPSGKKIWVTEGGFGGHQWPDPLHQLGAAFLYALRDGGVSLLTAWQTLTRDPLDVNGLMSLRGPTKKTYVAMQFWRFIRPGMVRIDARSNSGPDAVAFKDFRTGTTVIILLNRNRKSSTVSIHLGSGLNPTIVAFYITDALHDCSRIDAKHDLQSLSIPGESVVTLILGTGSLGR
ncbi:glycoside hydrolase family 30 beta sandwich domain-containing protein [Sulfuritalea sp.]|uniref:glycoside hydrolase family 30 beta sandwich domain-containing protein n=1 Tax=Sulfuritalea sp. TaxID=2480090 RepID=UPI001AD17932|nr:glycoside hydrolase family 30 beta sandwich domain-containing protein [Sulfuritalea sp.]MBN8474899.1 hypothetical protein [Sulfuritalea sp.]